MNVKTETDNNKLPDIFRKQNIKLIILFAISTLLLFSLVFGIIPVLNNVFVLDQPVMWNAFFQMPGFINMICAGLFTGLVVTVIGLFWLNIATIVSLIRLFITTFMILLIIIYISLRAI